MIIDNPEFVEFLTNNLRESMLHAIEIGQVVESECEAVYCRDNNRYQWTIKISPPKKSATYAISPENLVTTAVACLQFGEESE